jgi:acyl carrier protein
MRTPPNALKSDCRTQFDDSSDTSNRIRAVLHAHGRLGCETTQLSDDTSLYEAGMTSLASVNVMLALEGEFNIEFPDQMLNRSVFSSIAAIAAAIRKIGAA